MAIFMPAVCSPWAMDHAIERLLATPKTTAVRPCKSEDMGMLLGMGRITACWENAERRARDGKAVAGGQNLELEMLRPCGAILNFCVLTATRCPLPLTAAFLLLTYLHDFLDRGRRSDRPARGYESQAIGAAQDCEGDYQAYFLCDCSY